MVSSPDWITYQAASFGAVVQPVVWPPTPLNERREGSSRRRAAPAG